jgi:hypothetical protein
MAEMNYADTVLIGIAQWKRPPWKHWSRWDDNIEILVYETECPT